MIQVHRLIFLSHLNSRSTPTPLRSPHRRRRGYCFSSLCCSLPRRGRRGCCPLHTAALRRGCCPTLHADVLSFGSFGGTEESIGQDRTDKGCGSGSRFWKKWDQVNRLIGSVGIEPTESPPLSQSLSQFWELISQSISIFSCHIHLSQSSSPCNGSPSHRAYLISTSSPIFFYF